MESIADRLELAVRRKGISISEAARRAGISKSLMSAYCIGKYAPKMANVKRLAQALDVSEEWLISGDNENTELGDYDKNRRYLESIDPDLIPYLDELSDPKNKKRILFDKVKDLEPDDVESLLRVIRMFEEGK